MIMNILIIMILMIIIIDDNNILTQSRDQFWQVDHVTAVFQGGGECHLDNLRTLCTPCHREVTRKQMANKGRLKLQESSTSCKKISDFYQK